MKKWRIHLGWLDAISLLMLWMLICREYMAVVSLGTFAENLKTDSLGESGTFVWNFALKSGGNIVLIVICLFMQVIKVFRRQGK
jgi:hypothetical protein